MENTIEYVVPAQRLFEQARASAQDMTEEQKRKLIQEKYERARAYSEALQRLDCKNLTM